MCIQIKKMIKSDLFNFDEKFVMFNKNQSEGLAKVVDNLATATIVAVIVGGFVDNKLNFIQGIVLVVVAVTFLVMAYILRRGEEDGN